jgi:LacI family transcriptional regulator
MGRGRSTIEDVASRAGVSRQTVSRVINRRPNVSASARDRVEQAIEELGFVPNVAARRMGGARSFLVLAVIEREAPADLAARLPLDAMLLAGMQACSERGYHLMFEHVGGTAGLSTERDLTRVLTSLTPDGVILLPPLDERTGLRGVIDQRGIGVAFLGDRQDYGRTVPGLDDAGFGEAAAAELLSLGHRQIGFVCGEGDAARSRRRMAGYRRALAEAGSRAHRHFVAETGLDFGGALELARSWLVPTIRPTAIIAETEAVALAALQAAKELGLSVPRDLSLLALEDRPALARAKPGISVMHQPFAALFANACERLISASEAAFEKTDAEAGASAGERPPAHALIERATIARAPRAV